MPIAKTKNEDFFKTWSSDMAYVLGFFAADGSMSHTKRGGYYISFEITDLDLLVSIRAVMGAQNNISARKRNAHWKKIYRLQLGSKRMYGNILSIGFTPRKSLIMEFPPVPGSYLPDFIRGYFDGDGCVHFGKYWRRDRQKWKLQLSVHFTSGSRVFLEDLWEKMKPMLRGGHISKKERGHELVFGQRDSVALFRFMYNNGSALFLKRKYQKFQFALKELYLRA